MQLLYKRFAAFSTGGKIYRHTLFIIMIALINNVFVNKVKIDLFTAEVNNSCFCMFKMLYKLIHK